MACRPKRRQITRIEHHGFFAMGFDRECSTLAVPSFQHFFMTSSHRLTPGSSQRNPQSFIPRSLEMPQPLNGCLDQNANNWHQGESTGLRELCAQLHGRISEFLNSEVSDDLLKLVQHQTRIALGVAKEALAKYRYVSHYLSMMCSSQAWSLWTAFANSIRLHHVDKLDAA